MNTINELLKTAKDTEKKYLEADRLITRTFHHIASRMQDRGLFITITMINDIENSVKGFFNFDIIEQELKDTHNALINAFMENATEKQQSLVERLKAQKLDLTRIAFAISKMI